MYGIIEKPKRDFAYLQNLSISDSSPYIVMGYSINTDIGLNGTVIPSYLDDTSIDTNIKSSITHAISDAVDILSSNGITNNYNNIGIVEYHKYTDTREIYLALHEDDYGGVNYCVNTVIFYPTKTLHGANINIYREDNEDTLIETLDVTPRDDDIKIIYMEGNVFHRITDILSDGVRECIVVQLKCTNRN